MPQYEQRLSVPILPAQDLLALAYGTYQLLGWTPEFALETRLVGYSKKKWDNYYDHIIVDVEDGSLSITSKLPETASFDLMKRNKKNVAKFLSAFETVKASATAANFDQWKADIAALHQDTEATLVKQQAEAAEIEAVMKLSSGSKTVTYTIIGINVLVFAAMIMSGVHAFEPLVADIAKWGGNYKPYTLNGDWWRLITSTFVHIGIIHIAFNMYALYMVGIYLEPMLGKSRYIVAYLCTGVLASLASTWWHGSEMVSAGASGAIFGLYGVLLALLTTKLIPTTMRKGLLQSMGIFVVYNLIYGARSEATDNAAHLGGLLSGFVIGYLYFLSLKNAERFRPAMISGITVLATVLVTAFYLNGSVDQSAAYQAKLFAFGEIEEKALAPLQKYEQGEPNMLNDISTISVAQWQKAKKLFDETENYKLDEKMSGHRALIRKYIDLRIKHTDLLIVSMQGDKNLDGEINELGNQLNETVEKILKSNRE